MKRRPKSLTGPILAVVFLLAVFLTVRWIVATKRGPGSMTVVEVQSMDWGAVKAPTGAFPVGADYALERQVGGTELFPATVAALSDEDVVARVAGLVKQVHVYPGDRVKAGQLLATLQADELTAQALAGSLAAQAMESSAHGAERTLSQQQSSVKRFETAVTAADAGVGAARAELEAADVGIENAQESVQEKDAARQEALAQLTYAKANYEREKKLFEGGAISRDELDQAKRNIDEAQARIDQSEARLRQAKNDLTASRAKKTSSENLVRQAVANLDGAKAALAESQSAVGRAQADVTAMHSQSGSANATAKSSRALSSYTELRSSDSGVVTERLVSPGTPVMAGQTVLKVKVDRQLRVQAEMPQRLASTVGIGTSVRVVVNDHSLDATLTSVSPYVEGTTRSFRVEAVIDNPGGTIQAGSFAEIEVTTSSPVKSLSVRREAVKSAGDGTHYVWVVTEKPGTAVADAIYTCTMHPQVQHKGPGKCPICKMDLVPRDATGNFAVVKRKVDVGPSDSRYTAVLGGLQEGEQVTYAGDEDLFPGAAVSVVKSGAGGAEELPKGKGETTPEPGSGMGNMSMSGQPEAKTKQPPTVAQQDKYYCPMHPQVRRPGPGKCPICKMDLMPIKDGGK